MELYLDPIIIKRKLNGQFDKGNKCIYKNNKPNKTSFKKGNIPHNTKPIGTISLRHNYKRNDKYYYIKIDNNKWELLHRNIWEKEYGKIPSGYIVVFKDKNVLNCKIENLELITFKENIERNRNREKATETMKELWKLEKIRFNCGLERKTKLRIK